MKLELNRVDDMTIEVKRLGQDRNPVVIVDNVLRNPEAVRAFAKQARYTAGTRSGNYYPGYTSPCGVAGTTELGLWIAEMFWKDIYGQDPAVFASLDLDRIVGRANFSVLAAAMDAKYVNVHSDAHSWLALLIYLSEDHANAGTAFWRDKATGLQSLLSLDASAMRRVESFFGFDVTSRLTAAYGESFEMRDVAGDLMARRAIRPPFPKDSYHDGRGEWELLEFVPQRFNRMVAYPTWQLHSLAYSDYVLPADLDAARLTFNSWVDWPTSGRDDALPVAALPGLIQ